MENIWLQLFQLLFVCQVFLVKLVQVLFTNATKNAKISLFAKTCFTASWQD